MIRVLDLVYVTKIPKEQVRQKQGKIVLKASNLLLIRHMEWSSYPACHKKWTL